VPRSTPVTRENQTHVDGDFKHTGLVLEGKLMIKIKWFTLIEALLLCCVVTVFADDLKPEDIPPVPTPGLVTMVDLGAHKCIPCKMMAPIIAELQKEYAGRASIVFIDVWEHREQAQRFGIRGIPTQIFYDKQGREIKRHVGFFDKKNIVAVFDELDVPKAGGN
jgi:thioredoxin 1